MTGTTFTAPAPPALTFVTPEMAEEWLDANTENRTLRSHQVDSLARDMTAGAWQITGDPVKFDTRGILIDGQHRLWAIVQSGKTVPLFVIRNLPTEVRTVIDTGAKRSAGDVLTFEGFKSTSKLASTVRITLARQDGYYSRVDDRRRSPSYTNSEIASFAETHQYLGATVTRANSSYRAVGVKSTGLWAYCLSQFDAIDSDESVAFERSLVEMQTDGAGDPRATLLRWLQDSRRGGLHSSVILPRTLFAVFRTWNAWRQGEQLSKIQMSEHAQIPDLA